MQAPSSRSQHPPGAARTPSDRDGDGTGGPISSLRADLMASSGLWSTRLRPAMLTSSALAAACGLWAPALANPSGHTVVSGDVEIVEAENRIDIIQHSDIAYLTWDTFSTAIGEHIDVTQGPGAILYNHVPGAGPIALSGSLRADATIVLMSPGGIDISETARIDVGSLVATTAVIDPAAALAGTLTFDQPGSPTAIVLNKGRITAAEGGIVALVGPQVDNQGTIVARMGRITLAAGERFTVDFDGDQLITFAPPADTDPERGDPDRAGRLIASNSGTLSADGGTVVMTVDAARDVVDSVINMTGVVEARSLVDRNGEILLLGGADTATLVDGTLDVSAANTGATDTGITDTGTTGTGASGGRVAVTGDLIWAGDNTRILAAGYADGGGIQFGGAWQGGTPGDPDRLHTAQVTIVSDGAVFEVDSWDLGQGGEAVVWADRFTAFAGSISARGGARGGDGGAVEVSGKLQLAMTGLVDTLADNGTPGSLLLDPNYVVITGDGIADLNSFDPADPLLPAGADATAERPVLWLNALDTGSVTTSTAGSPVTAWSNIGSAGGTGTPGQAPTYTANAITNRDAVQFDGVNDVLNIPSAGAINQSVQADRTYTIVFKTGTDVTDRQVIYEEGGGTNGFNIYLDGGQVHFNLYNGSGAQRTLVTDAVAANTEYHYTMVFDGPNTTTTAYRNGVQFFNDTATGVGSLLSHGDPIGVGHQNGGTRFHDNATGGSIAHSFDGAVGELILANTAMSDEVRGLVEQEAAGRFGITLAEPLSTYSTVSEVYLEHLATLGSVSVQANMDITIQNLDDAILDIGANGLTLTAGNEIIVNSASTIRTTAGTVRFDGNTRLAAALTVDTGTGATLFDGTLNGTSPLTVASGDVAFNAAVGDMAALPSIVVTNAGMVTFADAASVGTFTQAAGTGTTDFGTVGLTASGGLSVTTGSARGTITTPSLVLATTDADLTGTVNGMTGAAAATQVTGGPFGMHFMNGCIIDSGACPSAGGTIDTDIDLVRIAAPQPVVRSRHQGGPLPETTQRNIISGVPLRPVLVVVCEIGVGCFLTPADTLPANLAAAPSEGVTYRRLTRDRPPPGPDTAQR